jgi:hypothetical protein
MFASLTDQYSNNRMPTYEQNDIGKDQSIKPPPTAPSVEQATNRWRYPNSQPPQHPEPEESERNELRHPAPSSDSKIAKARHFHS